MKNILFFLLFIPTFSFGQKYLPKSSGEVIKHSYFTLSYNENHEQAEWVHYNLNFNMIMGSINRTEDFRSDPKVSSGSATKSDYYKSGYDRGHLAPAGDMKANKTSMSESFYMSNMSPQVPSFNRGAWKKLETLVRSWGIKNNLFVITAGVLNDTSLKKIGTNNVSVPNRYYKIVYNEKLGQMIAFIMPNQKIDEPIQEYIVSVNDVEKLTGIDFFYEMNNDIEEKLESEVSLNKWSFTSPSFLNTNSSSKSSTIISNQCKGIAKSSGNRCRNKTKNENGYCYAHQTQSPNYKAPPKINYVGRCNATTKAGSRCKRNASSGSRYCWQHN